MIWWNWCVYYFAHREELDSNGCNPPLLPPAVVLGGLFFHGLNGWWGYKIVKRSLRTLSGKRVETVDNNGREVHGEVKAVAGRPLGLALLCWGLRVVAAAAA